MEYKDLNMSYNSNDVISSWIDDNINSINSNFDKHYKNHINTSRDDQKLSSYTNHDKDSRDRYQSTSSSPLHFQHNHFIIIISLLAKRLAMELDKRSKECTMSQNKIGSLEAGNIYYYNYYHINNI